MVNVNMEKPRTQSTSGDALGRGWQMEDGRRGVGGPRLVQGSSRFSCLNPFVLLLTLRYLSMCALHGGAGGRNSQARAERSHTLKEWQRGRRRHPCQSFGTYLGA